MKEYGLHSDRKNHFQNRQNKALTLGKNKVKP